MESIQRRSNQGAIVCEAAAADAEELALAIVVQAASAQDYDG